MNTEVKLNRAALRAYLEANRRVQVEQRDGQIMPLAILNTFLGVALWGSNREGAKNDPWSQEELAGELGISPTTLSSHMQYLSPVFRDSKPGMGLVELDYFPDNRRQKLFRLTPKGQALAKQLSYIIQGVQEDARTP